MIENYDDIHSQASNEILRLAEVQSDFQSAEDWLTYEKETAQNGMDFREMLHAMDEEYLRIHLIEQKYGYYIQEEGLKPEQAREILLWAGRGLVEPKKLTQAIEKGALLHKVPDIEKRLDRVANAWNHRNSLEQTVRHRHLLEPVRLNFTEIDKMIPGGITAGEVLHIVGGEGGMKTGLLLHILSNYVDKGGKILFFTLDMSPESLEVRLLMRIANCGKAQMLEYIKRESDEYLNARKIRAQQDDTFLIMGGPLTLNQMDRAILASGADVVAIDYLTVIEGFNSELETVRAATRAVRKWKNQWGTTFILLSQMSRESSRDMKTGGTGGHGIGGSNLEQLVDYEIELETDAPLLPDDKPRLIAKLRKNRSGPKAMFEIYPQYPSSTFCTRADRVGLEKSPKSKYKSEPW